MSGAGGESVQSSQRTCGPQSWPGLNPHPLPPLPPPSPEQGVPLRIELGPRDMEGGVAMLARRDTGAKESGAWDGLAARVPALLEQIQVRGSGLGWALLPWAL